MTDSPGLVVAGRRFRITDPGALSLQQDAFTTAVLERAGLTDPRLEHLQGEALVKEAHLRLMETGHVGDFLAGYLIEGGTGKKSKPWTRDAALANAKLFNGVCDAAEKDRLFEILGGLVLGFFSFARASWPTGPSSSTAPASERPSPNEEASHTGTGSP